MPEKFVITENMRAFGLILGHTEPSSDNQESELA